MFLKVRPRRVRRTIRSFRPSVEHNGMSRLETRALAGAGFRALGAIGLVTMTSTSIVPPADGVSSRFVENEFTASGGGGVTSMLKNVTQRRRQMLTPMTFVWINQVEVLEQGGVTTTITANAPGTSLASIQLVGDHFHQDSVKVMEGPVFVGSTFVPLDPDQMANAQWTQVASAVYSWRTADDLGIFNPNWTVTVNLTIDLSAPVADFNKSAALTINTPIIRVAMGMGNPYVANQQGLLITDGANNVLYQNLAFNGGYYQNSWTFPAVEFMNLGYSSALVSGPLGMFSVGDHGANQWLGYSFSMTLNV